MRGLDFSSLPAALATLLGVALIALVGVGIRLVAQLTIQQRRERANRQINERLRTLIAAYKVLGGSFTGDLAVDPAHLRDRRAPQEPGTLDLSPEATAGSDRTRRIRDAVEAALSDIILLGTDAHVSLAAAAARDLAAGRLVHTHDLVVALRAFIREALDLDPIPADVIIPAQGPTRPAASRSGARDGGREGGRSGQGGMGGGMAGGVGMGMGMGLGASAGAAAEPADGASPPG